ncbi:hypothetical protein [Stutzerimonas tarimensis]|uniref:Uncharacterized protein n=1 Tax=Stutzerimonas tarimensis TaxID=1507735 RepID=A0ABV7T7M6_9GAMM
MIPSRKIRPLRHESFHPNVLLLPASGDERDIVEASLERLMRSSLRVVHRDGSRGTVLILQSWRSTPEGFSVTFTPGVLDAVGRQREPLEVVEVLLAQAF